MRARAAASGRTRARVRPARGRRSRRGPSCSPARTSSFAPHGSTGWMTPTVDASTVSRSLSAPARDTDRGRAPPVGAAATAASVGRRLGGRLVPAERARLRARRAGPHRRARPAAAGATAFTSTRESRAGRRTTRGRGGRTRSASFPRVGELAQVEEEVRPLVAPATGRVRDSSRAIDSSSQRFHSRGSGGRREGGGRPT